MNILDGFLDDPDLWKPRTIGRDQVWRWLLQDVRGHSDRAYAWHSTHEDAVKDRNDGHIVIDMALLGKSKLT